MTIFALAIVIFAGNVRKIPAYPFDIYIASVKQHKPTARISQFAKGCGVSLSTLTPVYGMGANSQGVQWELSHNLPSDVYNKESDYLATAEVWQRHRVPRVVDLWFTDAESEDEELFCLDQSGRVISLTDIQWSLPAEGAGWWFYKRSLGFGPTGEVVSRKSQFFDLVGNPIPPPKLSREGRKDMEQPITIRKLDDFGFSKQMLQ
ncbi:MAG: hypothetical protein V4587_03740 [Acidobacteriota bacterium]